MAHILVADDHPDIVRVLRVVLEAEGHTITAALDGAAALASLERSRPDVLILDVKMPQVDGFRVLNRIRSSPELHDLKVVILTASTEPEDVSLGLTIGADYYLTKPFQPDDLASLIRRLCSEPSPPA